VSALTMLVPIESMSVPDRLNRVGMGASFEWSFGVVVAARHYILRR
jgi:hypothetical protein